MSSPDRIRDDTTNIGDPPAADAGRGREPPHKQAFQRLAQHGTVKPKPITGMTQAMSNKSTGLADHWVIALIEPLIRSRYL
jgi:hypothetical protein